MDTIVGKLYIIALFFSAALYGVPGSLTLRITDMQHHEIKEAAIGQPFILEVVLKGDAASQEEPIVKNLHAIDGRRMGYQMNSINGNTTVTYTYKARLDQEGTYVVGPVLAGNYKADPLTITVGKSAQLVNKKNVKKQKALLHFFVDSHDVMVNEKINCRLRFLFNDNALSLKHIGQQDIPGFVQSAVEGPTYGTEDIKGKLFNYAEWRWTLCPKESGDYVIPAYYADYTIKKTHHPFWGGFAQLLDDHDVRRIYSNAEKITVHSFDNAPCPVCAVGKNITIKASVDSAVVKQSEGMVLRVDIAGDSGCSFIGLEQLFNMPEELKWYRSNTIKLADASERTEFIIQGLKSGDYEIPAQKLCYFDCAKREYIPLKTEPIIISITPLHDSFEQRSEPLLQANTTDEQHKVIDNQLPLSKSRCDAVKKIEALPWWVFILVLLFTGMGVMSSSLITLFKNIFYGNKKQLHYKNAFAEALYAIKNAQRAHEFKKLYAIFVQLLSIRCAIPMGEVSLDRIEHELYNRFTDEKIRIQLHQFLNQLEEGAFGAESIVDQAIFSRAIEWIDILKKIV